MVFPAAAAPPAKMRTAALLDTWGGWEAEGEGVGGALHTVARNAATNTPHPHLTAVLPSSSSSRRELPRTKSLAQQLQAHVQGGAGAGVSGLCCCRLRYVDCHHRYLHHIVIADTACPRAPLPEPPSDPRGCSSWLQADPRFTACWRQNVHSMFMSC